MVGPVPSSLHFRPKCPLRPFFHQGRRSGHTGLGPGDLLILLGASLQEYTWGLSTRGVICKVVFALLVATNCPSRPADDGIVGYDRLINQWLRGLRHLALAGRVDVGRRNGLALGGARGYTPQGKGWR